MTLSDVGDLSSNVFEIQMFQQLQFNFIEIVIFPPRRRHSKKKARLPFWQSEWKWQSEGLAVNESTGIGNVKLSSSFRFHCLNQKQTCHDRMRNSLSYLWLIQTSDSKKGSLVKGFTHSRRVPWVEIFKKVHTKLSSHQNEASRSNEVLQIPTSSDPKY